MTQFGEQQRLLIAPEREIHIGGWHFLWLKRPEDHEDFALLRAFVHRLVCSYDLDDRIPECWEDHYVIVEELAALYRRYVRADGHDGQSADTPNETQAQDEADSAELGNGPAGEMENDDSGDAEEGGTHDTASHGTSGEPPPGDLDSEPVEWTRYLQEALKRIESEWRGAMCSIKHTERHYKRWSDSYAWLGKEKDAKEDYDEEPERLPSINEWLAN